MNLKVYDSQGGWVHVPNAASVEHAEQHARTYAGLVGELRVVELKVIEIPVGSDPSLRETS